MPSLWPAMIATLKSQLPTATDTTTLANIYATEYSNATATSAVVISSSILTAPITSSIIQQGFKATFDILSVLKLELLPNYKDEEIPDDKKAKQDEARGIIEAAFLPASSSFITAWTAAIFNPAIPMPGYISPTLGYTIIFPGEPTILAKDLAKAFFIAQTELDPNAAYIAHSTSLVEAYSKHLLTITGLYNGLIPGVPSPIPGPPIPWLGVA